MARNFIVFGLPESTMIQETGRRQEILFGTFMNETLPVGAALAGTISGLASLTGNLSIADGILAGTIRGLATLTGNLSTGGGVLAGSIRGVAALIGDLSLGTTTKSPIVIIIAG